MRGVTAEEISAHINLKDCINSGDLSTSIGVFVKLGKIFKEKGITTVKDEIIPHVAELLKGVIPDCIILYAISLWFARKV